MTFITLSMLVYALMLWALVAFVALAWWSGRDDGWHDDPSNEPDPEGPEPEDDWESWWLLDAEDREMTPV